MYKSELMEVEYLLTQEDLDAFQQHCGLKPRPSTAKFYFYPSGWNWWLVLGSAYPIISVLQAGNGYTRCLLVGAFLGMVGTLSAIKLRRQVADSLVGKPLEDLHNLWRIGPWRFSLNPEGIALTSELSAEYKSWSVIWKIEVTADHTFFYYASATAHIVPRHAFRDDDHYQQFLDLARRYQEG